MNQPLFLYGGKTPPIVATKVVALYDPSSGRVLHTHTVHVHEGARRVPDEEAIQAAYRHAGELGHDCGRLRVKVSRHAEHGHRPHRIDLATGEFVALDCPLRHDGAGGSKGPAPR